MPRSYLGSVMTACFSRVLPPLSHGTVCDRSLNALIWINSPARREVRAGFVSRVLLPRATPASVSASP